MNRAREKAWEEVVRFAGFAFGSAAEWTAAELWEQLVRHGRARHVARRLGWRGPGYAHALGNLLHQGRSLKVDVGGWVIDALPTRRYPCRWRAYRTEVACRGTGRVLDDGRRL